MSGDNPSTRVICWDSNVLLAWFKDEREKPELPDIGDFLSEVANGNCKLLLSAISFAEVLDVADSADPNARTAGTRFRQWIKRPQVSVANVDIRVADKAAELRVKSRELVDAGKVNRSIRTPDAIVAATAIIYRVNVMHTFDPDFLNLVPFGIFGTLRVTRPVFPRGGQLSLKFGDLPKP